MNYKDIKDIDVIATVQSIENDYGTDYTLWPENDIRLKKIHEWYINHPDKQKRNLSETDILRIQKLLDKQMQKKKICEMFEISPGKLIREIKMGILDDTKWKAVKESNNELRKNL